MCIATEKSEEIDQQSNIDIWKIIWISFWIYRSVENGKRKVKLSDQMKKNETEKAKIS